MTSTMKLHVALILLIICHPIGLAGQLDDSSLYWNTGINSELESIIRDYRRQIPTIMTKQNLPGLAIALIFDGQLIWAEGFGVTDRESLKPVTPKTLFSVQSISKMYTATMVMAAIDDGLLELDQPITKYLPDFSVNSRFEADPQKRITLRLLLGHHAGLTHEAPIGNNFDNNTESLDDHFSSISNTWLKFRVGERFSYSNLGIDLAGHILEIAYRQPFQRIMQKELFDPLGLESTAVDKEEIKRQQNRAIGHSDKHIDIPREIPMVPAGGIYSNVLDMARFIQFHLQGSETGGNKRIKPHNLTAMYQSCCESLSSSYGLGIQLSQSRFGDTEVTSFGHGGSGFGFQSSMYWYSELGLGIALIANDNTNTLTYRTIVGPLNDNILSAFLGEKGTPSNHSYPATEPIEVPAEQQKQFVGLYLGSRDIELVMLDGKLGWNFSNNFYPARFLSTDEIEVNLPALRLRCSFSGDEFRYPAWASCETRIGNSLNFSEVLAYNGNPDDPPGPDKPEWRHHLGKYEIVQWGTLIETLELQVKNGHLYFGKYRVLDETLPGLFSLADGEVLDLSGKTPTYRNIRLKRTTDPQAAAPGI